MAGVGSCQETTAPVARSTTGQRTRVVGAGIPSLAEPLRSGASAPQDTALVVGLEDYAFLPDVPYARADAQVFADWLVYTRGVPADRVQILTAGSVEDIREGVVAARRLAGVSGTVWVYYAGNGAV